MNTQNNSIIIDDISDHEGKYSVEIIKSEGPKKFIKQYKLSNKQLFILNESLSNNRIDFQIKNKPINTGETDQIISKHPEYRNNQLLSLDSYKQTINAKYGDYKNDSIENKKDIDEINDNYKQISPYDEIGKNYNSYISQSGRLPKQ